MRIQYHISPSCGRLFLAIIAFMSSALPGYAESPSNAKFPAFPWQEAARQILKGHVFSSNAGLDASELSEREGVLSLQPQDNYAIQPNNLVAVSYPADTTSDRPVGKIQVYVDRYLRESWCRADSVKWKYDSKRIVVADGFKESGFYRLKIAYDGDGKESKQEDFFVIVSDKWKKDILVFCRKTQAEIGDKPDPQLIRSCLVTSHFDNVMEIVSQSSQLSGEILLALADAVLSKDSFEIGKCPEFMVGLNRMRLKRFPGGPISDFSVFIPPDYDPSKKWPVVVHVDTKRVNVESLNATEGMIDFWWHTVSYKDINWKDFETVFALLRERLMIDEDRIYLDGVCDNGIAAMSLALHYPDIWAEAKINVGNSFRYLSGNAKSLPISFSLGPYRTGDRAGYCIFAIRCFEYYGCNLFYSNLVQGDSEGFGKREVFDEIRCSNPKRVSLTIDSLQNPIAYWVRIDGRVDENYLASIDASVKNQTITLKTKNIDAYTLNLTSLPVDSDVPIEIIENGLNVGQIKEAKFVKRSSKYSDANRVKNHQLHGPIKDVFRDPFFVVYGTLDGEFSSANAKVATSLAGGAPCLKDTEVLQDLVQTHNMVLVGSPASNTWLEKISKRLPVQVSGNQIMANGRAYGSADSGYMLIYPNPLNPERYVAVFCGMSSAVLQGIPQALSQMETMPPADVGVFEVTQQGKIKWKIAEKFNTLWDWHEHWDQKLAVMKNQHVKWRWNRWIARTVQRGVGADVLVCEDFFRYPEVFAAGEITHRDMFNTLKNDWLLEIELKGKEMKRILMVPFDTVSKREVDAPIVEGVTLMGKKGSKSESILSINEIEDEKLYRVVFPEKCVNGERLGLILSDYRIVGQFHLHNLLEEFLLRNPNWDIDEQLESLKFRLL